jgi:hypothetical protein
MYFSMFTVVYRIDLAQIMVYFSEMKFSVLMDSSNSFFFQINIFDIEILYCNENSVFLVVLSCLLYLVFKHTKHSVSSHL